VSIQKLPLLDSSVQISAKGNQIEEPLIPLKAGLESIPGICLFQEGHLIIACFMLKESVIKNLYENLRIAYGTACPCGES
jgi:hypothetical protein